MMPQTLNAAQQFANNNRIDNVRISGKVLYTRKPYTAVYSLLLTDRDKPINAQLDN